MKRRWCRFVAGSIVLGLLTALGVVAPNPVSAHPFIGGGHGAAAFSSFGGAITNLDGASGLFNVLNLNVPTTCTARYTSSSSCTVNGGNARPMQIGATAPQAAVTRGEFIGFGYAAGCAVAPVGCSGVTSGGSYRERVYYDGVNSYSNYFGIYTDDVSGGTSVTLMMVRYGTGWTLHMNGTHRWTISTSGMSQGFTSMSTESSGSGPATLKDQVVAGWQHKQVGAGFADVGQVSLNQPHAPACQVANFTPSTFAGSVVEMSGTC